MRRGLTDRDRIYWLLVLKGPMTAWALRQETNWTTHRLSNVLDDLRRLECVALIERGQHVHRHECGGNRGGRWRALVDDGDPWMLIPRDHVMGQR